MFTEGLDSENLRWVRGEDDIQRKEKSERVDNLRSSNRVLRLPSPGVFGCARSPINAISVSQTMPHVSGNDCESDMDLSSDSENEVHSYFSSSRETIQSKQGKGIRVGQPHHTEELLDSATSKKVPFMQSMSNKVGECDRGTYTLGDCLPNVTAGENVERTAKQDFYGRGLQNKKPLDNCIPSAPPFVGSESDLEQTSEQILTFKAHGTPSLSYSSVSATTNDSKESRNTTGHGIPNQSTRHHETSAGFEVDASSVSLPTQCPTFHASGQGKWCALFSYEACCRLCLHSWSQHHCMEAPYFLNDDFAALREAFGLRCVLLQPDEELLAKRSPEIVSEGAAPKSRKTLGKMKMQLQVRKVKMGLDLPACCRFSLVKPQMIKSGSLRSYISKFKSNLYSEWEATRKVQVASDTPANGSRSQFKRQVSGLLKSGMTPMHNSSSKEVVSERYSCWLRLKNSSEEDAVEMQPGSGETHVFFPDSHGDDLIIEVQDSKRQYKGHVLAQVASIADEPGNKLRWWPIFHEPEHELVGRVQLYISYSITPDENKHLKCGSVAETVAYDFVLEVAMKVQHIQQRNLLLHGPWKWLVSEFASYYGVSDAYTRLRYLSYVMDMATPTEDCLTLIHEFLLPVFMKSKGKIALSHQENRILGEIEDKVQQIIKLVFENYKLLDESSPSGMMDDFKPATRMIPPALIPAVKLYGLLHDVLNPEAQLKLCRYFQVAAKKRSRRHLAETDELILSSEGATFMDPMSLSTSYQKMNSLIRNFRNEIFTDIEIHNQHVLPSFIDLPNLSSAIYSLELCNRLCAFLVACSPPSLSAHVAELVIATADFQRDLASWNINPVKGGVDAKEMFQDYINRWIQEKRLSLLESCKLDKVKWLGVRTRYSTTPFVEELYDRLNETLDEYEVIICRWPKYMCHLEKVIEDIERAILEALDKQYADVLTPLKDNLTSKIYGLKYVQKIAKRSDTYVAPDELGILLNSMRRMLDVLRPKIETHLSLWSSCIPHDGGTTREDCSSEVSVMLRAKFRSYLHAVVEKLAENTRLQHETNLKKIIQHLTENAVESDIQNRMQPLRNILIRTIDQLHTIVEPNVFLAICRGFWDRMGQDILRSLENRRENRSYKGLRIAVSILDDIFTSEIQQLLGNTLQEKDLEPPPNIMEVRSLLCSDTFKYKDNYY
ncbi:uncharacterized protein LOC142625932 [Castanea sativa]|uniref:uncharacterized protein LOC142625932 n=1 Tax=Castanea sativa TaxID=21020 RepID=UPI003F64B99D